MKGNVIIMGPTFFLRIDRATITHARLDEVGVEVRVWYGEGNAAVSPTLIDPEDTGIRTEELTAIGIVIDKGDDDDVGLKVARAMYADITSLSQPRINDARATVVWTLDKVAGLQGWAAQWSRTLVSE